MTHLPGGMKGFHERSTRKKVQHLYLFIQGLRERRRREREILGENLRLGEDMLWEDSLMVLLKQLIGCFFSLVLIFISNFSCLNSDSRALHGKIEHLEDNEKKIMHSCKKNLILS